MRAIRAGRALATQLLLFPRLGLEVGLDDNLMIGAVFTLVSLVRSYLLRRVFEGVLMAGAGAAPPRLGLREESKVPPAAARKARSRAI